MFKPCLIVPVYRHAVRFAEFSKRLPEGLPVIVVDDGNGAEEKALLEGLGFPLVRLSPNRGKGAAMLAGMRRAAEEGYTHALQIDADGQHDPADIPRFLRAAEENPAALINSCPVYDGNAPKSRVYGRKITNFWVWVETGNRSIKDAMCGFRVYPLGPMKPVLDAGLVFERMGADIEILVKACRQGIEVVTLDTKVVYPEGGLSNFSMLKDNLKISALHTFLVFDMIKKRMKVGGKK